MADILVTSGGGDPIETDPVSSFSFDGIHEKAMAFGENTPAAEAAVEQVPPPVAEPAPVAETTPENIDNASNAQLAQLKDTDLVEVTVDGQKVQLPWSEARGGVMRQAHYTQSMQRLRQEQSAFQSEREALKKEQEEREILINLVSNPSALQAFIAKQYPTLAAQAQAVSAAAQQVDPDDIATVGQIQAAAAQTAQQMEKLQQEFVKSLEAREEQLTRTIEDRQATAKLSGEINTTIGGLFKEHPYIQKLIPNAEQVLRFEVLQLKPSTPEETVDAFKTVFGGWVENYKATVAETTKQTVVAKHKLSTNNIQPPGGAPPQPAPSTFKKVNKMTGKTEVDWDALRAVGMQMLK